MKCMNASGPHFEKHKLTYSIFLKSGKFVLEHEGILSSYGMKQCTVPVHFELTLFCLTTFYIGCNDKMIKKKKKDLKKKTDL